MALPGQKQFLQIQQEISQLVLRKTIADSTTVPSLTLVKQLYNDAYIELCSERDWWFMFNYATFNTVSGQATPYVMPDNVAEVRSMAIPAAQQKLRFATWDMWVTNYPGRYTSVGNTRPWAYIPANPAGDNALEYFLFPAADSNNGANYTVEYGYKQRITPLVGDTDTPIIPVEFQQCVINRALEKCFRNINDPRWEIYSDRTDGTEAKSRADAMWLKNEQFNDYVARFRNYEAENAFSAITDLNRFLFVPY